MKQDKFVSIEDKVFTEQEEQEVWDNAHANIVFSDCTFSGSEYLLYPWMVFRGCKFIAEELVLKVDYRVEMYNCEYPEVSMVEIQRPQWDHATASYVEKFRGVQVLYVGRHANLSTKNLKWLSKNMPGTFVCNFELDTKSGNEGYVFVENKRNFNYFIKHEAPVLFGTPFDKLYSKKTVTPEVTYLSVPKSRHKMLPWQDWKV